MPGVKHSNAARMVLAVFFILGTSADAERLISAQNSRTTRTDKGVERIYAGSVRALFGSVEIEADSAVVRTDGDDYLFLRGVRLRDGKRSIRADALTYVAADSVARFRGRVRIADGGRSIRAVRVEYDLGRQMVQATGHVRVRIDDGFDLAAERWFHDTQAETGRLQQGVEVTHMTDGDTVHVTADGASLSTGMNTVVFTGAPHFRIGNYVGRCDTLLYAREPGTVRLTGSASLDWTTAGRPPGAEPATGGAEETHGVEGDEIQLALKDGLPVSLTIEGDALLLTKKTQSDGPRHFQLRAGRTDMTIESGRIATVNAEGACRIEFKGRAGDSTSMQSDRSVLAFDAGHLARIDLVAAVVSHNTQGAVHHIEAGQVRLSFVLERIQSVHADSSARYQALDGQTHITSDQIELIFENGNLASAQAAGSVSGEIEGAR